jgi:hypothetical protein
VIGLGVKKLIAMFGPFCSRKDHVRDVDTAVGFSCVEVPLQHIVLALVEAPLKPARRDMFWPGGTADANYRQPKSINAPEFHSLAELLITATNALTECTFMDAQ